MTKLTNSDIQLLDRRGILKNNSGNSITTPNINSIFAGPLTFIQKEAIDVLTAPLLYDEFIGISEKNGSWGQDTVSIKIREYGGEVTSYVSGNSAITGGQRSSVNYNTIIRGVYEYEKSWVVDDKELNSAGFFNENLIVEETKATMKALAIARNRINFLGIPEKNNSNAPVYGILNDPELLPMITVPANKEGNTEWKDKTTEEIYNDIIFLINELQKQSKGLSLQSYNSGKVYRLGIANSVFGNLRKTNSYGLSALTKLKEEFADTLKLFAIPQMDNYDNNIDNIMMLIIDADDDIPTAKGSYMELARAYQIDRLGSTISQKIVSSISGNITQRPILIGRARGI